MAAKTNDTNSGGRPGGKAPDSGGQSIPKKKKQESAIKAWISENPNLAKGGLAVVLLVVLGIIVIPQFFGGEDGKRRGPSAARSRTPTPPAKPAPPQQQQPDEQPPEEEKEQPKVPEPEDIPEEKPPRSDDFSQWKPEDYYAARQEGDKRLIEAVAYLGKTFPHSSPIAQALTTLLQPPKVEEDPEKNPRPGTRARPVREDPKLIEAIISALGANTTAEGRTTLEQILAGKAPVEDDKKVVELALNALIDHTSVQHDTILLGALTAPEKLRPQADGAFQAEDLRQSTLKLVETAGSAGLRVRLAKYLVTPGTLPVRRESWGKFLLEHDHPDNLDAQLVFYLDRETAEETKVKLEGYFTTFSSLALRESLGIPEKAVGSSRASTPYRPSTGRSSTRRPRKASQEPDPDLPYRLARRLWSARCVALLEGRLAKLDSFEEQAQLVVLAGTIPVDSMRAALCRTLHERFEDGTKDLQKAGLSDKLLSDPGLLLIVKTLDRKVLDVSRTHGGGATPRAARRLRAGVEWMQVSQEMVRAWCQRLYLTASERAEAATSGAPAGTTALPIELHADAKVTAEYHAAWPGDVESKLSGVAPGAMEIHYVRIEQETSRKKMVGWYKRQLKARSAMPVAKSEWLDSYRSIPGKTGWKRSLDVLITQVDVDPRRDSGEDEDLIIEILSIEMQDPRRE